MPEAERWRFAVHVRGGPGPRGGTGDSRWLKACFCGRGDSGHSHGTGCTESHGGPCRSGERYFVAEDDAGGAPRLAERGVEVVRTESEEAFVASGLNPGDRVIVDAARQPGARRSPRYCGGGDDATSPPRTRPS